MLYDVLQSIGEFMGDNILLSIIVFLIIMIILMLYLIKTLKNMKPNLMWY